MSKRKPRPRLTRLRPITLAEIRPLLVRTLIDAPVIKRRPPIWRRR